MAKKTTKRLPKGERIKTILDAATAQAETVGYTGLSRAVVARKCKIAPSLITNYFKTKAALSTAVLSRAIETENLAILAQGLALRNAAVLKMAPAKIKRAVKWLTTNS